MATEVEFSSRRSLPRDFARVEPGHATVTRYLKKHAAIVYIQKKKNRLGYFQIVAYFAPSDVVEAAREHAGRCLREKTIQVEKKNRAQLLGAAAAQTLEVFFNLGEQIVGQMMTEYRRAYGERKAEYLRKAYSQWRMGKRAVSQVVRERLLDLLPPFLPLDQKYQIIKAIYKSSLTITTLDFLLRSEKDIEVVREAVRQHVSRPDATVVQSIVYEIASWLSDQDAQICLAMIDRLKQEEERLLSQQALSQIQMLTDFVSRVGMRSSAARIIELPSLKITIRVEK